MRIDGLITMLEILRRKYSVIILLKYTDKVSLSSFSMFTMDEAIVLTNHYISKHLDGLIKLDFIEVFVRAQGGTLIPKRLTTFEPLTEHIRES